MHLPRSRLAEYEKKLRTVRSEALDRVRKSCWENPEISLTHIVDEDLAIRMHYSYAGMTIEHIGPLIGSMPMHLTIAPRSETHVDASHIF